MSDYFVDLSASSNGDGSSGSPWNQFTSTENSSVSGGDYVWFRRVDPGDNNKLIAWKAGTDATTRINYVGWPLEGDPLYSSRPSSLRTAWDGDSDSYITQSTDSSSTYVATIPSYCNVYRFYLKHNYQNYNSNASPLKIDNVDYITLYNSKLSTWNGSYYANGCVCLITSSDDIHFKECLLVCEENHTTASYHHATLIKITDSTVVFEKTILEFGLLADINVDKYLNSGTYTANNISYIKNSTCNFNSGKLNFYLRTQPRTNPTKQGIIFINNSTTTISGFTTTFYNTVPYTNYPTYKYLANPAFYTTLGSTFKYVDSKVSWDDTQSNNGFLICSSNSNHILNNVEIDNLGGTTNYFINIDDLTNNQLTFTSISGSIATLNTTYNSYAYEAPLFIIPKMSLFDTNCTLSGINLSGIPCIFDSFLATSESSQDLIIDASNKLFTKLNNAHLVTGSMDNIQVTYPIDGITYLIKNQNTQHYIQGHEKSHYKQLIFHSQQYGCSDGSLINLFYNNDTTPGNHVFDIIIFGTSGVGNVIKKSSGYDPAFLTLYSKYNKNYTNIIDNYPKNYNITSLNDSFNSNTLIVETPQYRIFSSTVARTGGSGFSNGFILKSEASLVTAKFPSLKEDTIWVNLPNAGTFTVTGYFLYVSSNTLGSNDVVLILEKYESFYKEYKSTQIETDTSIWTPSITNATAYKVSVSIDVSYAQFIPIHFKLNNLDISSTFYFDSQLKVA